MGRALCPVITKVRVRFMVKPEFFQVGFFNRLGCLFNCEDHIHSHIFIRSSKYGSSNTVVNFIKKSATISYQVKRLLTTDFDLDL